MHTARCEGRTQILLMETSPAHYSSTGAFRARADYLETNFLENFGKSSLLVAFDGLNPFGVDIRDLNMVN